jgi:hypothetical protein
MRVNKWPMWVWPTLALLLMNNSSLARMSIQPIIGLRHQANHPLGHLSMEVSTYSTPIVTIHEKYNHSSFLMGVRIHQDYNIARQSWAVEFGLTFGDIWFGKNTRGIFSSLSSPETFIHYASFDWDLHSHGYFIGVVRDFGTLVAGARYYCESYTGYRDVFYEGRIGVDPFLYSDTWRVIGRWQSVTIMSGVAPIRWLRFSGELVLFRDTRDSYGTRPISVHEWGSSYWHLAGASFKRKGTNPSYSITAVLNRTGLSFPPAICNDLPA